jgi:hypothetical protein
MARGIARNLEIDRNTGGYNKGYRRYNPDERRINERYTIAADKATETQLVKQDDLGSAPYFYASIILQSV